MGWENTGKYDTLRITQIHNTNNAYSIRQHCDLTLQVKKQQPYKYQINYKKNLSQLQKKPFENGLICKLRYEMNETFL